MEENVASRAEVVALVAEDYRALLRRWAGLGLAGGAVYDGLIARSAERATAGRLLTLNVDHVRDTWSRIVSR